jgi:hypothetical protein
LNDHFGLVDKKVLDKDKAKWLLACHCVCTEQVNFNAGPMLFAYLLVHEESHGDGVDA